MAVTIGALSLAPVVCTGTGSTAASGWSVWQMRTDSPAAKLDELDTRISLSYRGLFLVTYLAPVEKITRQWLLNDGADPQRGELTLAGGAVSEVVELKSKGDQLRVVGAQPGLTIRIEYLATN